MAYLRRRRDEMALTEERPFAPATTPHRPESNEDRPYRARTQADTQYQSQSMVRSQTLLNPRQNAAAIAGSLVYDTDNISSLIHDINGVNTRPPFPQTQFDWPMPQAQHNLPQQNEIVTPTTASSTMLDREEDGNGEREENQDLITDAGQDARDG